MPPPLGSRLSGVAGAFRAPRPRRIATLAAPDGVRLAVHDLGGSGPPLLLVHATGFHGRVWAPLAVRLAARFRCVAPDLRCHGDSDKPSEGEHDWSGFADDVLTAIDGLGLERPFGVGHSSGATALLLAEQARAGTFRALYCFEPVIVPVEPPLGPDTDSWLAQRARARRATFASPREALRHYAARPPLSDLDPAVLSAYVEHGLEEAGGEAKLKCRPESEARIYEMATAHDCFARLDEVRCPVTLVRGERSEAYPPKLFEQMSDRLRQATSEVRPDLGHLGPLQRPDDVARSIRSVFAGAG